MTLGFSLELAASLLTIAGSWFYGNKSPLGPLLGVAAQMPWWALMIHAGMWGLLPLNIAMLVLHARALWKWKPE